MTDDAPSELLSRRHQMYPLLTVAEVARMQRFGTLQTHPGGTALISAGEPGPGIRLTDGRWLRSRSAVIASSARYRRPDVPRLNEFEGHGVWYWAVSQIHRYLAVPATRRLADPAQARAVVSVSP